MSLFIYRYAECRYAECYYAECRGATITTVKKFYSTILKVFLISIVIFHFRPLADPSPDSRGQCYKTFFIITGDEPK
jgi:hypothetical protein